MYSIITSPRDESPGVHKFGASIYTLIERPLLRNILARIKDGRCIESNVELHVIPLISTEILAEMQSKFI